MNLIDRYIAEVGKHLPQKLRPDIEQEIRSVLDDMLEDRSRAAGKPTDEGMVAEVLKEFGAPRKVAASYAPERYLIGPRLFPVFWLVTRIVIAVLGALALAGLAISLIQSGFTLDGFINAFSKSLADFFSGAISAFGNIVLIFFILEHFVPQISFDENEDETWDPHSLPEILDKDKVSIPELVVEIVFVAAAITLFNFYPQVLRLAFLQDGNWISLPLLSQAFFRYLPYLNILWVLQIALNVFLLRRGRRNPTSRWFEMAHGLLGVGLAYIMLKGPSLVAVTAEELMSANSGFTVETASTLAKVIQQIPVAALTIAIVVGLNDAAVTIYRLFTRK